MCLGKNHKRRLLFIARHKGRSQLTGIFTLAFTLARVGVTLSSHVSWPDQISTGMFGSEAIPLFVCYVCFM